MSTLKVDRIEPFSGGQVEIQGLDISGYATTGSNTFIGDQTISGGLDVSGTLDLTNTPITSDTDILITNIPIANTQARYSFNMDGTAASAFFAQGFSSSVEQAAATIQAFYHGGFKGQGYIAAYGEKGIIEAYDNTFETSVALFSNGTGSYIADYSPVTDTYAEAIKFQTYSNYNNGLIEILRNTNISGSLAVSGTLDLSNTPITSDTDIFIINFPQENTEARYVYNMDSTQVAQFIVIGRSGSAEEARVSMDAYYDGASKGLGYLSATGLTGRVEAWDKTFEGSISIFGDNTGGYIADFSPVTDDYANAIKLQPYSSYNGGLVEVLRPLEVSGSATFNQVLELAEQDPLPAGGVGQLAVSGSNLYYHNGSSWAQIN